MNRHTSCHCPRFLIYDVADKYSGVYDWVEDVDAYEREEENGCDKRISVKWVAAESTDRTGE